MFTKVVKVALFIIYEKTTTLFISEFLRGKAVWVSVMVVPPGESCVDGCVNGVGVVTMLGKGNLELQHQSHDTFMLDPGDNLCLTPF